MQNNSRKNENRSDEVGEKPYNPELDELVKDSQELMKILGAIVSKVRGKRTV
jgi:hypothetical protein